MEKVNGKILVVDDTPENIHVLTSYLTIKGYKAISANNGEKAIKLAKSDNPDLILLDIMMPGMDGYETCKRLKADVVTKDIPVIFITALSETSDIVRAFDVGAADYITKPINQQEVKSRVNTHLTIAKLHKKLNNKKILLEEEINERTKELSEANKLLSKEIAERKLTESKLLVALKELEKLKLQLQAENAYLLEEMQVSAGFDKIITNSPKMKTILKQIEQVAVTDSTVLLLGETGTGKELLAKAIHELSSRSKKPMIKVNCAALPANLIESELFGHEKGAFTGAIMRKIGRFELANNGTIFLDEIGDLPVELQSKLLRVLQDGDFERLGNSQTLHVDVRVIAATNRNLDEDIAKGNFRKDLYYRLSVFPIVLPPLRDRLEDIPLLLEHFIRKYSSKFSKNITSISEADINTLKYYDWPGNIREMENIIERAAILCKSNTLTIDMPFVSTKKQIIGDSDNTTEEIVEKKTLKDFEKEHIIKELIKTNWIIDGDRGAAKILGIPPSTLRDKMKKLGIKRS